MIIQKKVVERSFQVSSSYHIIVYIGIATESKSSQQENFFNLVPRLLLLFGNIKGIVNDVECCFNSVVPFFYVGKR